MGTPAKESSATAPQWGYSASPLVVDGKVIVFAGGPSAGGIKALDASTGAPVWTKLVGKESFISGLSAVLARLFPAAS